MDETLKFEPKLKIKPIDLNKIEEEIQEERNKRLAYLKANSKPLEELVFSEVFDVYDVISQSYATSIAPMSELRFGERIHSYEAGFKSILTLKVMNVNMPIKTLIFEGNSIVKAGDIIFAKIPRYQEETIEQAVNYGKQTFYIDREYKEQELAIELDILKYIHGPILRTDRAVDYEKYMKNKQ